MPTHRTLEDIRSAIYDRLAASVERLANASRREVLTLVRSGGADISGIAGDIERRFRISGTQRQQLVALLESAMQEIADARNALVEGLGLEPVNASELMATNSIDFPELKNALKDEFLTQVRRAAASGEGVSSLTHTIRNMKFGNAQTLANTSIAQFNNGITFEQAKQNGLERFLYYGPVTAITREFCRAHAGKIYTRDEILQMDNGQDLPVMTSCGGYNCRHSWEIAIGEAQKNEPITSYKEAEAEGIIYGESLSHQEGGILKNYTKKSGLELNKALRRGELTPEQKIQSKTLSKIIQGAPKYSGNVFRGLNFETEQEFINFTEQFTEGRYQRFRAFTSTSHNEVVAQKYMGKTNSVFLHIESKNGFAMSGLSTRPLEEEVLFDKGTKFFVDKIIKSENGNIEIYLIEL